MRIPVHTQEPVHISPDIPNAAYEQKRININSVQGTWPYNVQTFRGPPSGFYWFVDSIVVDIQCSADVGVRDVWIYWMDKQSNSIRFRIARLQANNSAQMVGTYGSAFTGWAVDGSTSFGTFPLPATVMQSPCAYGMLRTTFDSAGDTFNAHLLVREYRV